MCDFCDRIGIKENEVETGKFFSDGINEQDAVDIHLFKTASGRVWLETNADDGYYDTSLRIFYCPICGREFADARELTEADTKYEYTCHHADGSAGPWRPLFRFDEDQHKQIGDFIEKEEIDYLTKNPILNRYEIVGIRKFNEDGDIETVGVTKA